MQCNFFFLIKDNTKAVCRGGGSASICSVRDVALSSQKSSVGRSLLGNPNRRGERAGCEDGKHRKGENFLGPKTPWRNSKRRKALTCSIVIEPDREKEGESSEPRGQGIQGEVVGKHVGEQKTANNVRD